MKMTGGFRGLFVWIFLFHFLNPPCGAEYPRKTTCPGQNLYTPKGCDNFPVSYGLVICSKCDSAAYCGGQFVCARCDDPDMRNPAHLAGCRNSPAIQPSHPQRPVIPTTTPSPKDIETRKVICQQNYQKTQFGCTHFPADYGVVICFYCAYSILCRYQYFTCWRCEDPLIGNPELMEICRKAGATPITLRPTTSTSERDPNNVVTRTSSTSEHDPNNFVTPSHGTGDGDKDCQLWQLYVAWFVIIVCLIYDSFLLMFFVPGFPGYARMQCWMGRARRPRDIENTTSGIVQGRPKMSAKPAAKTSVKIDAKHSSAIAVDVEVKKPSTAGVKPIRKFSKVAPRKSSVRAPKQGSVASNRGGGTKSLKSKSIA